LACAAENGRLRTATALLVWGAKPGADGDEDFPPLDGAVYAGVDMVRLLLDAGAEVDPRTRQGGCTPLHLAATLGKQGVAEVLVCAGADVNAVDCNGDTPLHMAAREEMGDVLHYLVGAGGDVHAANKAGKTARDMLEGRTGMDAAICRDVLDRAMTGKITTQAA